MKRSEAIRLVYDTINANLKYDNVSTSREIIVELEKSLNLEWEEEDE